MSSSLRRGFQSTAEPEVRVEGLGALLEAELCPHCTMGVPSRLPNTRNVMALMRTPQKGWGELSYPAISMLQRKEPDFNRANEAGSEQEALLLLLISMSSEESW